MSARAGLWKETGDIIGSIFAYISISLVLFVLPTIGIYISYQDKQKLEQGSFKNKFKEFYFGVKTIS